ncbi:MAG: ABC transporter permease [Alphaproteobacteria bacterium]|nr:ABC transporter permease [Alphaproteobacteria bacterium]
MLITPSPEGMKGHLRSLWQSRHLVYWLTRRDVLLRYRQTRFGLLWVVLQPATMFCVYLLSLGYFARLPAPSGVPYALYLLTGLVPWLFFQSIVLATSSALQHNMHLITKVYFPRLVLVISAVASASFDYLWMVLILLIVAAAHGMVDMTTLAVIVLWSLVLGLLAMATGMAVAALSVYYRDLSVALPMLLQMVFFLSPVVYAVTMVPEAYVFWYYLNPVATLIESVRSAFGLQSAVSLLNQLLAVGVAAVSALVALYLFSRIERAVVDLA